MRSITFRDTPLSASWVSTRLFSSNRALASSSTASSASDCTFALASMMSSMLSGAVVIPAGPVYPSLDRRYRRTRTSAMPSTTVACESTHCPLARSVIPEIARFGRPAHVELDVREEALAVARPVAGLGPAAIPLRQRLRRAVGDDGLLEDALAVDGGCNRHAESSGWPDTHHRTRLDRNRMPALGFQDGPASEIGIPSRIECGRCVLCQGRRRREQRKQGSQHQFMCHTFILRN